MMQRDVAEPSPSHTCNEGKASWSLKTPITIIFFLFTSTLTMGEHVQKVVLPTHSLVGAGLSCASKREEEEERKRRTGFSKSVSKKVKGEEEKPWENIRRRKRCLLGESKEWWQRVPNWEATRTTSGSSPQSLYLLEGCCPLWRKKGMKGKSLFWLRTAVNICGCFIIASYTPIKQLHRKKKTRVWIKSELNDTASINLSIGPAHRVAQDIQLPSSLRLLVTNAAPRSDASGGEKTSWHGFLGRLFPAGRNQCAFTTVLSVAVSQCRDTSSQSQSRVWGNSGTRGQKGQSMSMKRHTPANCS